MKISVQLGLFRGKDELMEGILLLNECKLDDTQAYNNHNQV